MAEVRAQDQDVARDGAVVAQICECWTAQVSLPRSSLLGLPSNIQAAVDSRWLSAYDESRRVMSAIVSAYLPSACSASWIWNRRHCVLNLVLSGKAGKRMRAAPRW